jgi:hypothetical protein
MTSTSPDTSASVADSVFIRKPGCRTGILRHADGRTQRVRSFNRFDQVAGVLRLNGPKLRRAVLSRLKAGEEGTVAVAISALSQASAGQRATISSADVEWALSVVPKGARALLLEALSGATSSAEVTS